MGVEAEPEDVPAEKPTEVAEAVGVSAAVEPLVVDTYWQATCFLAVHSLTLVSLGQLLKQLARGFSIRTEAVGNSRLEDQDLHDACLRDFALAVIVGRPAVIESCLLLVETLLEDIIGKAG